MGIDDVAVTVTDTDAPLLRFAALGPGDDLALTEGRTATYEVALGSQPIAAVTVTISGHAGTELSLSPDTLTFTPGDWSGGRSVQVGAPHDDDAVDEDAVVLTYAVASADPLYDRLAVTPTTLLVADDDTAAVTVAVEARTVAEGAGVAYSVVLDSEPSDPLRIDVIPGGGVTVSPGSLVFHEDNWNVPQVVMVTALVDGDTADATVTVSHALAPFGRPSLPAEYAGVTVRDVTLSVIDDAGSAEDLTGEPTAEVVAVPGVTINPRALTIPEGGDLTYIVSLDAEPTADVTIAVDAGDGASVDTPQLTFTPTNWRNARTVTVTAGSDDDALDAAITISHEIRTPSAPEYLGLTVGEVAVTVIDDDEPGVTVHPTELTVPAGTSIGYTLTLDTEPSGIVRINITVGAGAPRLSLTFDTENWNQPRPVVWTAPDDDTTTITHQIDPTRSIAPEYADITIDDVTITTTPHDEADSVVLLTNAG